MSGKDKESECYKIEVKNYRNEKEKEHHSLFPEKILSKLFSINKKAPVPK